MAVSDMRMAGSALRLNRSDLMKLLEDEESGTNTSEFFDIPLQNVETTGTSDVTGSFLSKGRGNVLGYREGGRPTVGYQGPAEAIRELISAPKPTSTAAKSTPAPETPQEADKLYRGIAQGVNIYEQSGDYGVGFGQGDLRRALQEGYTKESIKDYLSDYYQGSIGPVAAEALGISPRTTNLSRTQPTQTQKDYAGAAGGVNIFQPDAYGVGFGAGDLRRAREAGYSSESIKKFLQGADIQIGEKARAALGM